MESKTERFLGVMQRRELVREPGDGEALAAPGRVLDQVPPTRAVAPGVGDHAPHGVELLVAGEDQVGRPPTLGVLAFHLVDELPDQIEDAVPGPNVVPEVFRGVSLPGRGDGWIACAAELAAVEGQEAGLGPSQMGGDVHPVRVHSEVSETAAMGEERLPGITVVLVLHDRVPNILTVQWILEFGGEEGDPVEEERQVQALLRLGAVVEAGARPRRGSRRGAAGSPSLRPLAGRK